MTIRKITPYQILDSRGEPTILVTMVSDSGKEASFSVPAGASKGGGEAAEKRDGDQAMYRGNGVTSAIEVINNVIAPKFIGYPLDQQDDFDGLLVALDGSEHKENLGGNTLLGLSVAYLKLSALENNKPTWQYIAELAGSAPEFPRLFANIVGGGKHAPGLDIQEYMIVPQTNSPRDAIKMIYDVYHTIQNIMQNLYGPSALLVGDEGGLAPLGTSSEVILEAFSQLNSKMEQKFDVALDAAANTFYKDGLYTIENQNLHASDLMKLYQQWDAKFPIYSIEDPFAEKDLEGMEILRTLPKDNKPFMIIADDFSVTNSAKIDELQKEQIFDGIIIKPNQVGTLTEVFEAVKSARASKAKIIVSHRSGETNDDFIVDLAYGLGAMGLKLGAPARGERLAKYNRLLQIQADMESTQDQAASTAAPARGPQTTQKDQAAPATRPAQTPSTPPAPPPPVMPKPITPSAPPPPLPPTPALAPNPVTPIEPTSPLASVAPSTQPAAPSTPPPPPTPVSPPPPPTSPTSAPPTPQISA